MRMHHSRSYHFDLLWQFNPFCLQSKAQISEFHVGPWTFSKSHDWQVSHVFRTVDAKAQRNWCVMLDLDD